MSEMWGLEIPEGWLVKVVKSLIKGNLSGTVSLTFCQHKDGSHREYKYAELSN